MPTSFPPVGDVASILDLTLATKRVYASLLHHVRGVLGRLIFYVALVVAPVLFAMRSRHPRPVWDASLTDNQCLAIWIGAIGLVGLLWAVTAKTRTIYCVYLHRTFDRCDEATFWTVQDADAFIGHLAAMRGGSIPVRRKQEPSWWVVIWW